MPKNETFKFCIEKIKLDTGLKQAEIAEKIDVKSTYLSDMINGRVPLTESVCQKISEVFHIDIPIEHQQSLKQQQYYGGYGNSNDCHTEHTDRWFDLLEAKEKSLAKSQEQIDKLLAIISQLTTK